RVARRLVRSGLSARTVVVKVKYSDFTIRSRRTTLPEPVQDTDAIYRAAVALLARLPLESRRVRLTGVSAGGLEAGRPAADLDPRRRGREAPTHRAGLGAHLGALRRRAHGDARHAAQEADDRVR